MSKIKSIIIVGGGSAGWMSAIYLNKVLLQKHSGIKITLVESPDIKTIGVGEATVPTICNFFSNLDIPEKELMKATDATFKSAIKFVNWKDINDSGYFHPFEAPLFSDGIQASTHWASQKLRGNPVDDFAKDTGIIQTLCESDKILKRPNDANYQASNLYAYHMDAVKMARFLRDKAIERGVTRIEDTVQGVNVKTNGEIASLNTKNNGRLEADFFIDCSGFKGILINETLGEEFVSFEQQLLCNSAITIQTPYTDAEKFPHPYTTSTAKSNGWIWEIGLTSRKGNGYVFSDKFCSFEEAESEIRDHLAIGSRDIEVGKIAMRAGHRRSSWSKNCLAVGLAAGFVEPLESTGLQFIQVGLELFFENFPNRDNYQPLQNRYNKVITAKYEDARDFIVAHYCLTNREDTEFWRYIKNELVISDSLAEQLELWKYKLPTHSDLKEIGLFGAPNYMYILAGMEQLVHPTQSGTENIPNQRSELLLGQLKRFQQSALKNSLTHQQLINALMGS